MLCMVTNTADYSHTQVWQVPQSQRGRPGESLSASQLLHVNWGILGSLLLPGFAAGLSFQIQFHHWSSLPLNRLPAAITLSVDLKLLFNILVHNIVWCFGLQK